MNTWDSPPFSSRYVMLNRAGLLKSTWTVEHCQARPRQSLILRSILGP